MKHAERAGQGGASRNFALLLALLAAGGLVTAWFIMLRGNPNVPLLESPHENTAFIGTPTGVSPTFEWRHGYATRENPYPRPATQFVVCILAAGQQCALPSQGGGAQAPSQVWVVPVESLQRTAVTLPAGVREVWTPRWYAFTDAPHHYRFTPPQPIARPAAARSLRWTVGACSGASNSECGFAEARTLRFLEDINLKQAGLAENSVPNRLIADALAENTGGTNSESFKTVIAVQEIMLIPGSNQVFRDLDSPDFSTEPQVFTTDGRIVPRSQAPRDGSGGYDWTRIVGIRKPGSQLWESVEEHPDLIAGGGPSRVAHIEHVVTSRPARFAIFYRLDLEDAIAELDESDNAYAERSGYFP